MDLAAGSCHPSSLSAPTRTIRTSARDPSPLSTTLAESPTLSLLDHVRTAIRLRHYSIRTEDTYLHWIKRFLIFHQNRHPAKLGSQAIEHFLSMLAVEQQVSAATQNQALNAIVFLYRHVLALDLGELGRIV